MILARGEIWWVRLDPTEGSEIRKTRPCLVLTADTLNRFRRTVVVIPYSTVAAAHPPITIRVTCQGKPAVAVIDQVRAIAKERLVEPIEVAPEEQLAAVTEALADILELG
ncbi:MAG: type II toxin-antitoxin system PemK/MazF family toxin [Thermoanaerobaculia bacterium]